MLSYQHVYHAGNFADVHKHALLCLLLEALGQKLTPLCYYETHAGRGLYDLTAPEALKTGEFQQGIVRFLEHPTPQPLDAYRRTVLAHNPHALRCYPGSPALALALTREHDQLVLMELHPTEYTALKTTCKSSRIHLHRRDGFEGLKALTPPRERRGLVLIDPSYEVKDDYRKVVRLLREVHARWRNGVYALWYPLLSAGLHRDLLASLKASGIRKILHSELTVRARGEGVGLYGSGMVIVNPPWPLAETCATLLPWLADVLTDDGAGTARLDWLVPE